MIPGLFVVRALAAVAACAAGVVVGFTLGDGRRGAERAPEVRIVYCSHDSPDPDCRAYREAYLRARGSDPAEGQAMGRGP